MRVVKAALRILGAILRSFAWLVSWFFLLLAVFVTAYIFRRTGTVERPAVVFTLSWGAASLLSMCLLWRWKRPRTGSIFAAILFLGAWAGLFLFFCRPIEKEDKKDATESEPAPTFHVPSQRRSIYPTPSAPRRQV